MAPCCFEHYELLRDETVEAVRGWVAGAMGITYKRPFDVDPLALAFPSPPENAH